MRELAFVFIVLVVSHLAYSQNESMCIRTARDSITGQNILIGRVTRKDFSDSSWYVENYSLYNPTESLVRQIDSLFDGDSVTIYFGSWCSDSQMWVPMFLHIVDKTALKGHVSFVALPRSRGWRRQLTDGLEIEKVPTFIFYQKGKEIGRIEEEPRGDLGSDVIEILRSGQRLKLR
ncbi:MAG: thioredoxin family protein [Candidatus Kryptoniota bacterium]